MFHTFHYKARTFLPDMDTFVHHIQQAIYGSCEWGYCLMQQMDQINTVLGVCSCALYADILQWQSTLGIMAQEQKTLTH